MQLHHAIHNNIALYEAVLAAHGAAGRLDEHFWSTAASVPPYYSNLVTRTGEAGEAAQSARLQALAKEPPKPGWGFKDSFDCLDPLLVEGLGLHPLFQARWYGWEASAVMHPEPQVDIRFERVGDKESLAEWESAWQRSSPAPGMRMFRPSLLRDPALCFLSGLRQGQLVGGALLNLSFESVGLSNVFALDRRTLKAFTGAAARAARERHPDRHVVGYGPVSKLEALAPLGFRDLGGLRVWATQLG